MSTVPFVNPPLLPNQTHMCWSATPNVGLCAELGSLACWQRKWNVFWYVCECVCARACLVVCTFLSEGVSDESRTLPQYFASVYLLKCVVASSSGTACACVFVSEEGEECPARTQLSKHIPVSCLAPLLSRRNNFTWIYLFILPRPGPSSRIGIVAHVPPLPKTGKVFGKLLWEPSKGGRGVRKEGLKENTYTLLFNHFIFLPAGSTCDPSSHPGTGVVTGGLNVNLDFIHGFND